MSEPSTPTRQILTPGDPAATAAPAAGPAVPEVPARAKPGPRPRVAIAAPAAGAAGAAGDDLADFESETLPPAPQSTMQRLGATSPFSPEQEALVARMISTAVQAARSGQDAQTAAHLAAGTAKRMPSQAEAMATLESSVANGIRPRAILSDEGWVTHREMTRVSDDLAKLPIAR